MKVANFNRDYVETAFLSEGFYDFYNYSAATMESTNAAKVLATRRSGYDTQAIDEKTHYIYEFVLVPNLGFLADPQPLPTDCELKLSFDRASASTALLSSKSGEIELKIKDCYAMTEWVTSPALRSFFSDIEYNPIAYSYEEVEVLCKPLALGQKVLRLDNIRGGNIPTYIFAGIIPTNSITGDFAESSTSFSSHNVSEMNITLNGHSVNGYPITIKNNCGTFAQFQFNETVGRSYNIQCGSVLTKAQFKSNFIWAHRFEAEQTAQGWIGFDIKLRQAFATSHTMVIWLISPKATTIDKYHQVTHMYE